MSRNLLVAICAVILTIALIALGEWINLHTTAAGEVALEQGANLPGYSVDHDGEIKRRYGLYFGQLEDRRMKQQEFLIYPLIALVITLFVGLFVHTRVISLTAICLIPLLYYVLLNPWWWGRRLHLAAGYMVGALLVAFIMRYLKRRIRPASTV
jgi:hypothetical protein